MIPQRIQSSPAESSGARRARIWAILDFVPQMRAELSLVHEIEHDRSRTRGSSLASANTADR